MALFCLSITALRGSCGHEEGARSRTAARASRRAAHSSRSAFRQHRARCRQLVRQAVRRPARPPMAKSMTWRQLVAAHRTLPFQTMVRVRNLTNDKTVDVRIIDRGPFVDDRIIDLSHAAARAIELIGPGIGPVELTILSSPASAAPARVRRSGGCFPRHAPTPTGCSRIWLRSYGAAKEVLRQGDPPLWRVLAGQRGDRRKPPNRSRSASGASKISPQAFVVRLDP